MEHRYWTGPRAELSVCCGRKFRHKETDHGDGQTTFASLNGFDPSSRGEGARTVGGRVVGCRYADEQARIDDPVDCGFLSYETDGTRCRTGLRRIYSDPWRSFSGGSTQVLFSRDSS